MGEAQVRMTEGGRETKNSPFCGSTQLPLEGCYGAVYPQDS